jgi:hypothetical protein
MIARLSSYDQYVGLDKDTPALDLELPHGAKLCALGVVLPEELDEQQWLAIGKKLITIGRSAKWALAELAASGDKYGDRTGVAKKLNCDVDYLYNLAYVARNVPISSRNEVLSFKHHMKVAKLSPAAQKDWLEKAAEEEWSANKLEQEIRKKEDADRESELEPKDASAYRIMKSCKNAAEAISEFEKIAKGGGGNFRLDHALEAIITDDPFLKDLPDETLYKMLQAAISVADRVKEVIDVLERHQKQRVERDNEAQEWFNKREAEEERAEKERNAPDPEEGDDEPPAKSSAKKKSLERERMPVKSSKATKRPGTKKAA